MKKFRVGDIVIGNYRADEYAITTRGYIGEVVSIDEDGSRMRITGVDDSNYKCAWKVKTNCFDLYTPEKIVIQRRYNEVIATEYPSKRSATARCNPCDKFDFSYGAKLAINRLYGCKDETEKINKTEPLNTEFVVVRGDEYFLAGHIYKITNGKLESPITGNKLPTSHCFYTIDDVKEYFSTEEGDLWSDRWSAEGIDIVEVIKDDV